MGASAHSRLGAILPLLQLVHLQPHAAHAWAFRAPGQQLQGRPQKVHVQVPLRHPALNTSSPLLPLIYYMSTGRALSGGLET